jgi:hypothetical protein
MKLLTVGNTKTIKGEKLGYMTFIMHLAPSTLSGYQACPMASNGCAAACLNTAGRGRFTATQEARIRKTRWYFEGRETFMAQLVKDILAAIRKANREQMTPVFRLNGTSDIRWETVPINGFRNIMEMFTTVQFYDYSKIPNRRDLPANYHLTFSRSEINNAYAKVALDRGMNVAVVFDTLPNTYMGRTVIDGTQTDLRFLDEKNVIVGLLAKGKANPILRGSPFSRNLGGLHNENVSSSGAGQHSSKDVR